MEIPRFFQFHLIDQDYWTTPLMENPNYVRISSIWDELLISGLIPLLALTYFNGRIYCKIRSSGKFEYRFVGSGATKKNSSFESEKSGKSRNSKSKEKDDFTNEKQSWGVSEPPLLQYKPTSESGVSLGLNHSGWKSLKKVSLCNFWIFAPKINNFGAKIFENRLNINFGVKIQMRHF